MSLPDLRILYPEEPCLIMASSGPIRCSMMVAAASQLSPSNDKLKLLEIGSFTGTSAMSFIYAINLFFSGKGHLTCVDPWVAWPKQELPKDFPKPLFFGNVSDRIDQILDSGLAYNIFVHNTKLMRGNVEVTPFRGISSVILPMLSSDQFDLIFVDGDHSYEGCLHDIIQSKRLLKDGGILCGDDLELELHQCDRDFALRAGMTPQQYIDPCTGRNFHPGVALAVAEAFPKVTNVAGFWAVRKCGNDYIPLDLTGARMAVPPFFPDEGKKEAIAYLRKILNLQ